jgi:putative transcriptional regulator
LTLYCYKPIPLQQDLTSLRIPHHPARSYDLGVPTLRAVTVIFMNNRLRELRTAMGWSQAEVARRLAVSRQTINSIEMGHYDPSLPLAFAIARLFGTSIENIFYEEGVRAR